MTIYPIGTKNDDETRNIINNNFGFLRENSNELLKEINDVKKYIDNKGEEILSESVVNKWLSENEFKPKDAVATFNDLPKDAELKEIRGVIDENAVYVYDGTEWVKQSNLNFDGLSDVKTVISDRVNVQSFGVVGDGITDDTVNLQKAVDYAVANKVKLVSRKLKCLTKDTVYVKGILHLKGSLEIFCDHTNLGLKISKDDNTAMIPNSDRSYSHDINISVTRKTYTPNDSAVGIYINNVYFSKFDFQSVKNHKIGVVIDATNNQGTAYNKINLGRFSDNYDGIVLKGSGGGWVTENSFYGGSFGADSLIDTSQLGSHIKIIGPSLSHSNNNKFYNTSLEGFHPAGVEFNNTTNNIIYSARMEMPYAKHVVKTNSTAQSNEVHIQYGANLISVDKKFEDLGRFTKIIGNTHTQGIVFYYDSAFYEFVQKGGVSKIDTGTIKKISIGRKVQKTISGISGALSINLNEADHFFINAPSGNITSVTIDGSLLELGEEKTISFLQGSSGVDITGFPSLFLGKKATAPANRAYGRDVYKVIKGTTANEIYTLSHYAN